MIFSSQKTERLRSLNVLPPELLLFDFNLDELNRTAANIVGTIHMPLPIVEVKPINTLGFIRQVDSIPRILLHSLINVPWLPAEVMLHILIHEHIHRIVPGREIEPGVYKSHPAEFWEMERNLSPNARTAWCWIRMEWDDVLKRDAKNECIWVRKRWKAILRQKRKWLVDFHKEAGMPPPPENGTSWREAQIRSKPSDDNPFLISPEPEQLKSL